MARTKGPSPPLSFADCGSWGGLRDEPSLSSIAAEGRIERFSEFAAEFVRLGVDIIVAAGSAPVLAAKQASSRVPIVFPIAIDPVAAGLVASLARPGGNITGLSVLSSDLAGKRLEILREVIPHLGRLAILANADNPGAVLELRAVEEIARIMGCSVTRLEIRQGGDIRSH